MIGNLIGGIASGLFGLAANTANVNAQNKANAQNMAFAREQFNYQKELNDLAMSREDNAVRRRVADLEAAGFNKRLAMDQAAGSQGLSAGNYNANQQAAYMDPGSVIGSVTGTLGAINEIRTTESQLRATEIQNTLQLANVGKVLKESKLLDTQDKEAMSRMLTQMVERQATWKDVELKESQRKQIEKDVELKESQRKNIEADTTQRSYENDWSKGHSGEPISIYNQPASASGSFGADNPLVGGFNGSFNISGPSGAVRDPINKAHAVFNDLKNAIGDSPLGEGTMKILNTLGDILFSKKEE